MSNRDTSHAVVCPNCGAAVRGEASRYCTECGQRLELTRLRLSEILAEVAGGLYSFELPILRTGRDLLKGPGPVAAAWIEGKRRTYTNPVKFVVIVGVVVAFTYAPIQELRRAWHESGAFYDVGLARHAAQYFGLFAMVLGIPIAALARVFGGASRAWLEWYVLALYAYGIATALQLTCSLASVVVPDRIARVLLWIELCLPSVLFAWGALGFGPRGSKLGRLVAAVFAQVAFAAIGGAVYQAFA